MQPGPEVLRRQQLGLKSGDVAADDQDVEGTKKNGKRKVPAESKPGSAPKASPESKGQEATPKKKPVGKKPKGKDNATPNAPSIPEEVKGSKRKAATPQEMSQLKVPKVSEQKELKEEPAKAKSFARRARPASNKAAQEKWDAIKRAFMQEIYPLLSARISFHEDGLKGGMDGLVNRAYEAR